MEQSYGWPLSAFFFWASLSFRLGKFQGIVYVHTGKHVLAFMMALVGLGLSASFAQPRTDVDRPDQVNRTLCYGLPWIGNTVSYRYFKITRVIPLSALHFSVVSSSAHPWRSSSPLTEGWPEKHSCWIDSLTALPKTLLHPELSMIHLAEIWCIEKFVGDHLQWVLRKGATLVQVTHSAGSKIYTFQKTGLCQPDCW